MAATQMLATLIIEQKRASSQNRQRWMAAALVLLAIPLGVAVAWFARPAPLLTVAPAELPQVPRMENVAQQYWNAMFAQTEDSWKAVGEYFPPEENTQNRLYSRLADRQLGEYYLNHSEFDKALTVYQQLAAVEETAKGFRLIGLAGEAIVYDRLNQPDQVLARLPKIMPERALLDRFLDGEIEQLAEKYRRGETK